MNTTIRKDWSPADPKKPCKGCDIKHFGCHTNCNFYAAQLEDIKRKRKFLRPSNADCFYAENVRKTIDIQVKKKMLPRGEKK